LEEEDNKWKLKNEDSYMIKPEKYDNAMSDGDTLPYSETKKDPMEQLMAE